MSEKIDIYVKCFNRPFYLDRLLRSLDKFLIGNFRITILDDGTPKKYLDRITVLHPRVMIRTSDHYQEKSSFLINYQDNLSSSLKLKIPSDFWIQSIKSSSNFFFLLEDDMWLTSKLDISEVIENMKAFNLVMVKAFWQGNERLIYGSTSDLCNSIIELRPKTPFKSTLINSFLLYNRFRVATYLLQLGLINHELLLRYWSTYSVAGAFFRKDYWMYLWENMGEKVDESRQLLRAIEWKKLRPNCKYGRTKAEVLRTSYRTAATPRFPETGFDVIKFNEYLNQRWLNDRLDVMENFPTDFSDDYLRKILAETDEESIQYLVWKQWVGKFEEQYLKMGCEVD